MTRSRIYGTDVPFCDWMRRQKVLDSSHFVATDVDLWVHCYRTRVDGKRTRKVQGLQFLEVKTRSGNVHASQIDTLWKIHRTINAKTVLVDGNDVINCGVSFISLSSDRPDNSDLIKWGRFNKKGQISWTIVNCEKLEQLMLMEHDPQTLEPCFKRLHHKTQTVWNFVECELGFTVAEAVIKRS